MEDSILLSVKTILNIEDGSDVFDEEVLNGINASFSVLHDLGVIYDVVVSDDTATWSGRFGGRSGSNWGRPLYPNRYGVGFSSCV